MVNITILDETLIITKGIDMKNITEHIGILTNITRLKSSSFGNPRFKCQIAGFTCQTSPDSAIAYEIENHRDKKVTAMIGTYYNQPTIMSLGEVRS